MILFFQIANYHLQLSHRLISGLIRAIPVTHHIQRRRTIEENDCFRNDMVWSMRW
jgi:hypothetical protein